MDQAQRICIAFVTSLSALALLASCSGARLDEQQVKPLGSTTGWAWVQAPELLDTPLELYKRINGAGEKLIQLGWKRAIFGTLEKNGLTVHLIIHELENAAAASSLVARDEYPKAQEIAAGDGGIYWQSGLASEGILYHQGPRLYELTIDKKQALEELMPLIDALERLTP